MSAAAAQPAIVFEGVSKSYPASSFWWAGRSTTPAQALRDVSFTTHAGEVLALLGPNGSGKSTLCRLVTTLLTPDSGKIRVAGVVAASDARQVLRRVGFTLAAERSFYPRLTARENLEFFAALEEVPRSQRPARTQKSLACAGLLECSDHQVMKLSTGMVQRLALARALLKEPRVLVLDEPTRSLDPGARESFWELLRRLAGGGTAILLATHSFDEAAAVSDSVAILLGGTLICHERMAGASHEGMRATYQRNVEHHETALAEIRA